MGQGSIKEAQKGGSGYISPALTPLIFIPKFLFPVVPKSIVIKPSQRSFSFPGGSFAWSQHAKDQDPQASRNASESLVNSCFYLFMHLNTF